MRLGAFWFVRPIPSAAVEPTWPGTAQPDRLSDCRAINVRDMAKTATIATIADLTPDPRNPRKRGQRAEGMIVASLQEVGAARSIVIDEHGRILAGNGTVAAAGECGIERVKVVDADGETIVAVRRTGLTEAQKTRLGLLDNRTGELAEWDAEVLAALAEDGTELGDLWANDELEALLGDLGTPDPGMTPAEARRTLAEQFLVPPFSVLDARQGYWQERKRAWIALGIHSELGRGDASPGGGQRDAAHLRPDGHTRRGDGRGREMACAVKSQGRLTALQAGKGNGLLGEAEQARTHYSEPAWKRSPNALANVVERIGRGDTVSDAGAKIAMVIRRATTFGTEGNASEQTGTSIFDPVLCEAMYLWFCPPGGTVLDPFAGGSVRGIVAAVLGRHYTGIDLSVRQIEANREQAREICPEAQPTWIAGDALARLPEVVGSFDFMLTCPPYADLERYSDDPRDLSTMGYDAFLAAYRRILALAVGKLAEDRFAVIVIGDVRDKKGMYRNFPADTVAAMAEAGASLFNEAVLVTMCGSLPIRAANQFPKGRKLGKTHQNVLVFVKGDAKRAVAACGPVEVPRTVLTGGSPDTALGGDA